MRHILTDLRGNPIYSSYRRLRRTRNSHASTLLLQVQNHAWNSVVRRIEKFPNEVWICDESGNTPLHIAARHDPPVEVVKAMSMLSRVANHDGITPLHVAASHRCSATTLKTIIDCGSSNLKSASTDKTETGVSPTADLSRMGRAPFHYACLSFRGLDLEAFTVLLDATLKDGFVAVTEAESGLPDFEEFDEDFDEDYVDMKTSKAESETIINVMGMKDGTGQTPLGLLFRRYRERVRCVISTVDRLRREHPDRPNQAAIAAALAVHDDLGDLWQKARWIVGRLTEERLEREGVSSFQLPPSPAEAEVAQGAAQFSLEQHHKAYEEEETVSLPSDGSILSDDIAREQPKPRKFRIVHASVGLTGYGCPPEMIRLALSMYPHQVFEMDEEGNLPLHIAVKASSSLVSPFVDAGHNIFGGELPDDHSVVSALSFFSSATISQTSNPFDKVIKILLQKYPDAAKVPHGRTGRLPLVIAIESGLRTWEDGIRSLLNAYPPALHDKKLIEPALFPDVLGLVVNNKGFMGCADILFGGLESTSQIPMGGRFQKIRRRENCARTTMFQLLRAKPEWLVSEEEGSDDLEKAFT